MRNFIEDFQNMANLMSKLFDWRMKLWIAQQEEYITKGDACRFQLSRLRDDPCFIAVLALGDVGGTAQIMRDQVYCDLKQCYEWHNLFCILRFGKRLLVSRRMKKVVQLWQRRFRSLQLRTQKQKKTRAMRKK
jgi:hypothetical protein